MLPGTIEEQNNRTPDATRCTVGVKVYDARLRKPLLSLFHFTATSKAPEDTNASPDLLLFHFTATSKAPEDTNASPEDPKTRLHCVSETYVCTNPALFRRSLPLIRKCPSDSRKNPSYLRCSCTTNARLEITSNAHQFFYAYCNSLGHTQVACVSPN